MHAIPMEQVSAPAQVSWAAALACPLCGGPLAAAGAGLHCAADGTDYPVHPSGLLDLRPPEARVPGDGFAAAYRAARLAEGWAPLSPEIARSLPAGDPPGFPRLYWPMRRGTWAALRALLPPAPATMADVGAGFPWLSHRLAEIGHRVVALDLSPDADFGLGAARAYPTAVPWDALSFAYSAPSAPGGFLPVLGDMCRPPLADGAYDVVLCNASLHYAADLKATVRRLAAALRPRGLLALVDSPVAASGSQGSQPGSRILGRGELETALRDAGLIPAWQRVGRGLLWWQHRVKTLLLRRPGFGFPIVMGHR